MLSRRRLPLYSRVVLILFVTSVIATVMSCGGSNPRHHSPTAQEIVANLASAHTEQEAQAALNQVYTASGLRGGNGSLIPNVAIPSNFTSDLALIQLNSPTTTVMTYGEFYDRSTAFARSIGQSLTISESAALGSLNSSLVNALSNPNGSPTNSMLFIFASADGHAPAVPPVITRETRLTALQVFLVGLHLGISDDQTRVGLDNCISICKWIWIVRTIIYIIWKVICSIFDFIEACEDKATEVSKDVKEEVVSCRLECHSQ